MAKKVFLPHRKLAEYKSKVIALVLTIISIVYHMFLFSLRLYCRFKVYCTLFHNSSMFFVSLIKASGPINGYVLQS